MKVYIVESRYPGERPEQSAPDTEIWLHRTNAVARKRRLQKDYPHLFYRVATYERVAPTRKTVKGRKARKNG